MFITTDIIVQILAKNAHIDNFILEQDEILKIIKVEESTVTFKRLKTDEILSCSIMALSMVI